MTSDREGRPPLEAAEREFVDRLEAVYAPPPPTPAERAGFDDAIRTRLERSWRRPLLIPALGAAAAALAWLVLSPSTGPISSPTREEPTAALESGWEDELFLSSDLSGAEDREEDESLPDDYLAIASAFLD